MKLYYEPSATTCRPIMLLAAEHEIPLDYIHIDLMAGEHLQPAYEALNANKAVPLLVDGEFRLTESSAILKYLADLSGSAAYPADLRLRARINAAMDWFNTGFYRDFGYGLVYARVLPHYAPPAAGADEHFAGADARSRQWLSILDRQIAANGGDYLLGDAITLADYLGSSYATIAEWIGFDHAPWPHVQRWLSAMRARPAWDEVNAAFHGLVSAIRAQAQAQAA